MKSNLLQSLEASPFSCQIMLKFDPPAGIYSYGHLGGPILQRIRIGRSQFAERNAMLKFSLTDAQLR